MGTLNNTVSYEEQQELFNAAKDGNKTSFWKLFDLYKDDVFCKLPIPKRFYNAHCRDDLIHSAGVIACEDIGKAESLHRRLLLQSESDHHDSEHCRTALE